MATPARLPAWPVQDCLIVLPPSLSQSDTMQGPFVIRAAVLIAWRGGPPEYLCLENRCCGLGRFRHSGQSAAGAAGCKFKSGPRFLSYRLARYIACRDKSNMRYCGNESGFLHAGRDPSMAQAFGGYSQAHRRQIDDLCDKRIGQCKAAQRCWRVPTSNWRLARYLHRRRKIDHRHCGRQPQGDL
jgi:hypothetical protein